MKRTDWSLCDKGCQWLTTGVWFSPVSSNKTDRHDITDILLKMALNTITTTINFNNSCIGINSMGKQISFQSDKNRWAIIHKAVWNKLICFYLSFSKLMWTGIVSFCCPMLRTDWWTYKVNMTCIWLTFTNN
jgi:hypothetical protein